MSITNTTDSVESHEALVDNATKLQRTIDGLSLNQALVDFELANARVLDLTARLIETQERVRRYGAEADSERNNRQALSDERDRMLHACDELRRELDAVRAALDIRSGEVDMLNAQLHASQITAATARHEADVALGELATLRGSKSFRVAAKLGRVARAFRS